MFRALLVATAVTALAITAGQPASAASDPLPQFTNLVGTCSSKIANIDGRCFIADVTTLENNTTNCPGTSQFFSSPPNDANNVPIDWTFANNAHACISVSYDINPPNSFGVCEYWFYVPAGHATGNIIFGYWVNNAKHTFTLNENPVSGWQKLFTDAPQSVTNDGFPGAFDGTGPRTIQWQTTTASPPVKPNSAGATTSTTASWRYAADEAEPASHDHAGVPDPRTESRTPASGTRPRSHPRRDQSRRKQNSAAPRPVPAPPEAAVNRLPGAEHRRGRPVADQQPLNDQISNRPQRAKRSLVRDHAEHARRTRARAIALEVAAEAMVTAAINSTRSRCTNGRNGRPGWMR